MTLCHSPENPVDAGRYNISFSQCMKISVLVEIKTTNMVSLETHFHRITMLMKTTFTKLIFICLFILNKIFELIFLTAEENNLKHFHWLFNRDLFFGIKIVTFWF